MEKLPKYSKGFKKHRQDVIATFRSEGDYNDYSAIRNFLGERIPDFDKKYGQYDEIFRAWHKMSLEISTIPPGSNSVENARRIRDQFIETHDRMIDPINEVTLLMELKPVLLEITNLIPKNRS